MALGLTALVRQAYPSPEWAVFFEVANATGFRARRRADAVALGIWPSRGHTLVGFEFKEDRRDWLRERDNPAKADEIAQYVDQWFMVIGKKGIATPEEMPAPWGLLCANDDRSRLLTLKPCVPFLDRDHKVIHRSFAAAMLRKVTETTTPNVEVARLVEEQVKLAVERTREGHDVERLSERCEQLQKALDTFKAATGVDLKDGWRGPEKISAAVQAVLEIDTYRRNLEHAGNTLRVSLKEIEKALGEWPEAKSELLEA